MEDLQADDAALAAGLPWQRLSVAAGIALTLGVAQPDSSAPAIEARSEGIPVLRRSTGGTAVLQLPGDLTWARVLPRSDPEVGRDYARAFGRLGAPVVRALERSGIRARWAPAPGLVEGCCLLSGRGDALWVGDRVVGGAAQHSTSRALLHHGILNVADDPERRGRPFHLAPEQSRRLVTLEELLGEAALVELRERLAEELAAPV